MNRTRLTSPSRPRTGGPIDTIHRTNMSTRLNRTTRHGEGRIVELLRATNTTFPGRQLPRHTGRWPSPRLVYLHAIGQWKKYNTTSRTSVGGRKIGT